MSSELAAGRMQVQAADADETRPVALITGAGAPRIGAYVADTLARHGYRLALHARTSLAQAEARAQAYQQQGVQALAVGGDLREEREVAQMVERVLERFGRVDALVNCAAVWQRKPLEQVAAADVRLHLEVNLLGTFLCCQRVGLVMVRQAEGGAIVNVGDWAVARPYRDYAAYFPSKGGIPALTRAFAVELASRNPRVRVNAVLPGPVMLPPDLPEDERAAAIAGTLLRREGRPQHVADAVLFLLQCDYITGVCLPVDGGRSIAP
jgi:pteridine reductase